MPPAGGPIYPHFEALRPMGGAGSVNMPGEMLAALAGAMGAAPKPPDVPPRPPREDPARAIFRLGDPASVFHPGRVLAQPIQQNIGTAANVIAGTTSHQARGHSSSFVGAQMIPDTFASGGQLPGGLSGQFVGMSGTGLSIRSQHEIQLDDHSDRVGELVSPLGLRLSDALELVEQATEIAETGAPEIFLLVRGQLERGSHPRPPRRRKPRRHPCPIDQLLGLLGEYHSADKATAAAAESRLKELCELHGRLCCLVALVQFRNRQLLNQDPGTTFFEGMWITIPLDLDLYLNISNLIDTVRILCVFSPMAALILLSFVVDLIRAGGLISIDITDRLVSLLTTSADTFCNPHGSAALSAFAQFVTLTVLLQFGMMGVTEQDVDEAEATLRRRLGIK